MSDSPSRKKGFIGRELQWGVLNDETQLKAFPCIKAFCQIDSETFATSDGRNVTIWTPDSTIATLNLRALSLYYIRRIHHIVAFVQKSVELFFISMRSPYSITKHPFPFSNKVITVMHFFENQSILVTAGQGLMFTKVIIPTIFKTSSPIPEMLKFEKVTEIYQDQLFVSHHSPVFMDSSEVVIVYFETSVKFHLLDGTCIQQFDHFTMAPISCLSFYEHKNMLVVGDQEGHISIITFQCKHPFMHGAHPETGGLISSYRPEVCHLLFSQIFEDDFLVTIGLNKQITVFSLVAEKIIQQVRINTINPQLAYFIEPHFLIFSEKEIISFTIDIFTKHFSSLSADGTFLSRCPSLTTAARLLCITSDSIVSLFSPKNAKLLFGISAVDYQHDIKNVVYPRDIINDGISVKPLYNSLKNEDQNQDQFDFQTLNQKQNQSQFKSLKQNDKSLGFIMNNNLDSNKSINFNIDSLLNLKNQNDYGFFRMGDDALLMVDFNVKKSMEKNKKNHKLFTSMTFMDAKYLNSKTFEWPSNSQFVSLLRIETNRYPSSLMGICKSGVCHILSVDKNQQNLVPKLETFSIGYGRVICATFSSVHKYVTFSCLYHTIIYDLDNHKVLYDVEQTYFRSLFVISDRSIACGCANGALEIRNYPQLTIQASSQKHEVYHSDHGYRRDLTDELENYERMMDIEFAISSIDYCSPRNALLTISPNGELFIWTIDCFPICHIIFDFTPTAACFLNGHGSIIFSALRTLYTIDWHYFFSEKLENEKTLLDDFDILDDKFDLQQFAETRLEHAEELEFLVKQKQTPSHKFKRVYGQENFETLAPLNSRPSSKMNFRPFRIRRDTSIENDDAPHFFEDLTVEQEDIPKNYFYRQEEYLAPKPKRRKIQKPVEMIPNLSKNISLRPSNNNNNNNSKNETNTTDKNKQPAQKSLKSDKNNKTTEIKVRRKNRRECETENSTNNTNKSSSIRTSHSSTKASSNNNSKKKKKQSNNQLSSLSTNSTKVKATKTIKVKKVTKSTKVSMKSNLSARRIKMQSSSSNLNQINNNYNSGISTLYEISKDAATKNTMHRLNTTPCQSQNQSRRRKEKKKRGNQNINESEYEYTDENENQNEETDENENKNKNQSIEAENNNNYNKYDLNNEEATFDFESDEIIIRDPSRPKSSSIDSETANASCQTHQNLNSNIELDTNIDDQNKIELNDIHSNQKFKEEVHSLSKSKNSELVNKNKNIINLPNIRPPRSKKRTKKGLKLKNKTVSDMQEKTVIEIHMGPLEQDSLPSDWRLLGSIKNKSPRNRENQIKYEIKEPNSQFFMSHRNKYNKNITKKQNEDENDSTFELVSAADETIKSPLLYVQNYGESGDEEHFSEPYVIEDLTDPRMKFSTDTKMKYLKMKSIE